MAARGEHITKVCVVFVYCIVQVLILYLNLSTACVLYKLLNSFSANFSSFLACTQILI